MKRGAVALLALLALSLTGCGEPEGPCLESHTQPSVIMVGKTPVVTQYEVCDRRGPAPTH